MDSCYFLVLLTIYLLWQYKIDGKKILRYTCGNMDFMLKFLKVTDPDK